jgi:hypothetical protein
LAAPMFFVWLVLKYLDITICACSNNILSQLGEYGIGEKHGVYSSRTFCG